MLVARTLEQGPRGVEVGEVDAGAGFTAAQAKRQRKGSTKYSGVYAVAMPTKGNSDKPEVSAHSPPRPIKFPTCWRGLIDESRPHWRPRHKQILRRHVARMLRRWWWWCRRRRATTSTGGARRALSRPRGYRTPTFTLAAAPKAVPLVRACVLLLGGLQFSHPHIDQKCRGPFV